MITYIVRRLLFGIIVIFLVTIIIFYLIQMLPGDPARTALGDMASREQVEALRHELWLDRPLPVQYGHWLINTIRGDLGTSIVYHEPVIKMVAYRLPVTIHLAVSAFILSTIIGVAAGTICAVRRGGILDSIVTFFANIGVALPVFWLGMICIYFFGLKLGWVPTMGYTSPFDDLWLNFKQIVFPVFCIAVPAVAGITRQTRSSMLEVVRQDYIRTARSKGVRELTIVLRHALKNALIPVVTLLGIQLGFLVGGQVLVETVFNIPGMGRLITESALNKDFPIVQACTLLIVLIVVLVNILIDIFYGWLDPKVRYE